MRAEGGERGRREERGACGGERKEEG